MPSKKGRHTADPVKNDFKRLLSDVKAIYKLPYAQRVSQLSDYFRGGEETDMRLSNQPAGTFALFWYRTLYIKALEFVKAFEFSEKRVTKLFQSLKQQGRLSKIDLQHGPENLSIAD